MALRTKREQALTRGSGPSARALCELATAGNAVLAAGSGQNQKTMICTERPRGNNCRRKRKERNKTKRKQTADTHVKELVSTGKQQARPISRKRTHPSSTRAGSLHLVDPPLPLLLFHLEPDLPNLLVFLLSILGGILVCLSRHEPDS